MTENEMEDKVSFAELLESSPQTPGSEFAPGDTVSGTVVKITKDTVFIGLGGKSEGIADVGTRALRKGIGLN
jgi:ribosomal protein S1